MKPISAALAECERERRSLESSVMMTRPRGAVVEEVRYVVGVRAVVVLRAVAGTAIDGDVAFVDRVDVAPRISPARLRGQTLLADVEVPAVLR